MSLVQSPAWWDMDHLGCPTRTKAPLREQLGEGWLITDTTARHVDENRLEVRLQNNSWIVRPLGPNQEIPLFCNSWFWNPNVSWKVINLHSSPVKINKDEGLPSKNEDMNQFELQVISEKKGWVHGEFKQFGHLATTPKAITKFWHLVYRLKRLLPTWMSFWAAPPEPKFSDKP